MTAARGEGSARPSQGGRVNDPVLSGLDATTAQALQRQAAAVRGLAVAFVDPLPALPAAAVPELVVLPTGSFYMGCRRGEFAANPALEGPLHQVRVVRGIAIGRSAVTRAQYQVFCDDSGHMEPRPYLWQEPELPVFNVSWEDARAYCRWLSDRTGQRYRLPTEAEWEYAARAGGESAFSFGDRIGREEVNCRGGFHCTRGLYLCGLSRPVAVGSLPANAWGLHEMHGNVQEWCLDHWREGYAAMPREADTPFRHAGRGHRHARYRVVRGGSWFDAPAACRSAARQVRQRDEFDLNLGFRVVRELDAADAAGAQLDLAA